MEILCHLEGEQISGALVVKTQKAERSIFVDAGRIVFAHSNLMEESLGQYLLLKEKISRQELEDASHVLRNSGKRLGRVLLEMGILDYDSLWEALRSHLLGIVWACFRAEKGEYTLIPGHCLPNENILINQNIVTLVWQLMRKAKLPRKPDAYLNGMKKVFLGCRDRLDKLDMTQYEAHVLALIEREHRLEAIVDHSELLPEDTRRILAVLRLLGMVADEPPGAVGNDVHVPPPNPFVSFDEALRHYNALFEMIFKMLKKEIGPIAMSISQNALEEIRESLPAPFRKIEITQDGKLNSDQLLQKTVWFGDMARKMGDFIGALDEILYAQIYAVRKNLGVDHEQQVLRWVRGDRN